MNNEYRVNKSEYKPTNFSDTKDEYELESNDSVWGIVASVWFIFMLIIGVVMFLN